MPDSIPPFAAALADRYRFLRELGAGGMATVYLAQDLRHGRPVALKVVRPEITKLVGGTRFLEEIRTTASLQHPNILPLFDSGEADGHLFYVMPFVEGESLRDRLDREGPLPLEEAVRLACDVAGALDYAHRKGVVHRDIKPENILLQDGRPLVADFGVALAVRAVGGDRLTETGLAVGTPRYMSPEQVTGEKEVTHRADIHALGAVLYETLAGEPPFSGGNAQALLMKILTEAAPKVGTLRASVPPHVEGAVAKSLEKVPADRFKTAADFAAALRGELVVTPGRASPRGGGAADPSRRGTGTVGWGRLAPWALLPAAVAAGWMVNRTPEAPETPVARFTIPVPGGVAMGVWPNLAISPVDGAVVYFAGDTLLRRPLDRMESEVLGVLVGECCPSFTEDGRWIVFENLRGGTNGISVEGGPKVDLSAQFSDRVRLAGTEGSGGIMMRPPGESEWVRVTELDTLRNDGAHLWPEMLPDGRHLLFTALPPSLMWEGARIEVQDLRSGERRTVVEGGTFGRFLPSGHVVYVDGAGTLQGVPFDPDRMEVTGPPVVLEEGIRTSYWGGAAAMSVSPSGHLAFLKGSSLEDHILTWMDRGGRVIGTVGRPHTVEGIRLSPDGRRATTYVATATSDIGIFDMATGEMRRFTFEEFTEDNPVWSEDGRRIAYHQVRSGQDHRIYARDAEGSGEPELLYSSQGYTAPRDWSGDGRYLVAYESGALVSIDLEGNRVDTVTARAATEGGRLSPDGNWLAYASRETGRAEIYVVGFPGLGGKRQVSRDGGRMPEWSRGSGELFYLNGDTLLVTQVTTGESFVHTPPRALFVSPDMDAADLLWYSVSGDGERFLFPAKNPEATSQEIEVVVNWSRRLQLR